MDCAAKWAEGLKALDKEYNIMIPNWASMYWRVRYDALRNEYEQCLQKRKQEEARKPSEYGFKNDRSHPRTTGTPLSGPDS